MPDDSDTADAAARALYAVAPEEFLARRGELAASARSGGDAITAQAIERMRKPTAAAWIVNVLALGRPAVVDELAELGARLREAQDALDAARMRELTTERRSLVAALCKEAFALAGRRQPSAALRDEVSGTFEAALADPDVAARLGRLQRAENWSGFGFAATGAPELTLVRGGRSDTPDRSNRPQPPSAPKLTATERRRQERALTAAREAFAAAETAQEDARRTERDLTDDVRRLTKKLSRLQSQLDDARTDLESARKAVTAARTERREARSALDRAEREARD